MLGESQLLQGFERCLDQMEDLSLDVPEALATFKAEFVKPVIKLGLVPETFAELCIPMSVIKEKIDSMIMECVEPPLLCPCTAALAQLVTDSAVCTQVFRHWGVRCARSY